MTELAALAYLVYPYLERVDPRNYFEAFSRLDFDFAVFMRDHHLAADEFVALPI